MEDFVDPWLMFAMVALVCASFATWVWLLTRREGGRFLEFEPRRPVPWNSLGCVMALLLVLLATLPQSEPQGEIEAIDLPMSAVSQTLIIGTFFMVVVIASSATASDIGLPRSLDQAMRDVAIGIVAWLAAMVPVYALNMILLAIFSRGEQDLHPLIDLMREKPDPMVLIVGTLMAVVLAPVAEETTFRLLLQGWLEKWEVERDGSAPSGSIEANSGAEQNGPGSSSPFAASPWVSADMPSEPPSGAARQAISEAEAENLAAEPSAFAHPGWLPIAISSVLFCLAHFGHGTDPIALLPLAVILGYVYQRTHRILPSIVAHALFNLTATLALWRVISVEAQ